MARLKVIAKKAAKKATTKILPPPVKSAKIAVKNAVKEVVRAARGGKTMEEQYDELDKENTDLKSENATLKAHVAKLEQMSKATIPAQPGQEKKWIRGKLAGEKLIKTDPETGKFAEIDKAEWDSLA